jgi:acid phosphatase
MSRVATIVLLVLLTIVIAALGDLTFTVLGDWGVPLPKSFSNNIGKRSAQLKSKAVFAIGDNFYITKDGRRMGVKSKADKKWKSGFIRNFPHRWFKHRRFYVIAGNHDYDGNELAQLDFHRSKKDTRWYFPRLYYKVTKKIAKNMFAEFFMLDTTPLYYSDSYFQMKGKKWGNMKRDLKQVEWLKNQLAASKAKWKIVMAHHQVVTTDGASRYTREHIKPLLDKYKIPLYVNGHLHNFQHVTKDGVNYVTTGNVAFNKGKSKGRNGGFVYSKSRGFTVFRILDAKKMQVIHYTDKNKRVYANTILNR